MKAQDETRIREQLDLIARWRASGLPKAQWTAQHGVELKHLMGWLTYERRWKARLSGHNAHNAPFIALPIAPSRAADCGITPEATIRIEYCRADVILHWPMGHSTQLAHFLGQCMQTPQP